MKRILLIGMILSGIWSAAHAQIAVVAPSLELQEAMSHAERMQQAVQTYEKMSDMKEGIDKGIDAVEKVNRRLTTVRDVQQVATRSAACIRRLQKLYETISGMSEVDPRTTMNLLTMCNQTTRECVNVTSYGARVFSDNFMKMNDAERLAETRKVLDDLDKLLARTNYINVQVNAIQFNNEMLNAYFQ